QRLGAALAYYTIFSLAPLLLSEDLALRGLPSEDHPGDGDGDQQQRREREDRVVRERGAEPLGLVIAQRGEGRLDGGEVALHALRKRATSMHSHPLNTALQLGTGRAAPKLHGPPVPWQDPLEVVVEQSLHRRDLLAPRVPTRAAEGVEVAAALAPGEVVA